MENISQDAKPHDLSDQSPWESFKKSAFRLESLPEYRVDYEAKDYADYLAGKDVDITNNDGMIKWCDLVKSKIAVGARMDRARIVCNPSTDYLRFEMTHAYEMTTKAGEVIRLISEDDFDLTCDDNELDVIFNRWGAIDFWLLDENHLLIMDYDDDGTYIGINESKDEEDLRDAIKIRDAVMRINHFVEV